MHTINVIVVQARSHKMFSIRKVVIRNFIIKISISTVPPWVLVKMPSSDVYDRAILLVQFCIHVHICRALSFPKSVDDLRSLSNQLQLLMEQNYYHIVLLYGMAYLYKQTFAIPGSVFMVNARRIFNFILNSSVIPVYWEIWRFGSLPFQLPN